MKQFVSNLIPEGKGYNIVQKYFPAEKSALGLYAKYAQQASPKKYATIQSFCSTRVVPAVVIQYNADEKDAIPLYMPCSACSKWLGELEQDNSSKMCLECFAEGAE